MSRRMFHHHLQHVCKEDSTLSFKLDSRGYIVKEQDTTSNLRSLVMFISIFNITVDVL
jgi:hypothetical protein